MILALAAVLATGLGWWVAKPSLFNAQALRPIARAVSQPQPAGALRPVLAPSNVTAAGAAESAAASTMAVADPMGGAADLKRVFDEHITSPDPRQRRVAARAFNACVPAFLVGQGETPSPEPLIRALAPDRAVEREAAYRSLFARCHRLLGASRASLADLRQQLQSDRESHEPGLAAQESLINGRDEGVERLVLQALARDDPAGVAALSGFAAQLALRRSPDASDLDLVQRARAVDAALPWVACDLGLDCTANGLGALQLCAVQGLCEGDMPSRFLTRAAADGIDRAAIQMQRARLLALMRNGRVLGIADLLP